MAVLNAKKERIREGLANDALSAEADMAAGICDEELARLEGEKEANTDLVSGMNEGVEEDIAYRRQAMVKCDAGELQWHDVVKETLSREVRRVDGKMQVLADRKIALQTRIADLEL